MAFDSTLADRLREYLAAYTDLHIEEKKMFGGLAFMVNDKMCVNVSGDKLMCRYDPDKVEEVSNRVGYEEMIMKGRAYKGYCYVHPEGFKSNKDFSYWMELCLSFNEKAQSSKKKK